MNRKIVILIFFFILFAISFLIARLILGAEVPYNDIFDKAISYFGALGLPTVLFYWEWKRNRDDKHYKEKKRKAKIEILVSKIQKQLPNALEQIENHLNHWNKIIQYKHINEIMPEELAKIFSYEERKFVYNYLESNKIIYLDSTQNIGLPNKEPPIFQDIIKNLNSAEYREKLIDFFSYIE